MNKEQVLKNLGDMDPGFVEEAAPRRRRSAAAYLSCAAAALLVVFGASLALKKAAPAPDSAYPSAGQTGTEDHTAVEYPDVATADGNAGIPRDDAPRDDAPHAAEPTVMPAAPGSDLAPGSDANPALESVIESCRAALLAVCRGREGGTCSFEVVRVFRGSVEGELRWKLPSGCSHPKAGEECVIFLRGASGGDNALVCKTDDGRVTLGVDCGEMTFEEILETVERSLKK